MNDNISYNLVVKSEESGVRLDKYIATHISTISRTRVQELIKQKLITTNGLQTKLSYKVNTNDKINIEIPYPQPLSLDPENLNLDIIYEDDDVIVVNKPQGMVVHPSAGHPDHTLVNG
ncbi:S4 domain-containing protein, partial [Lactobacillus iners]